MQDETSTFDDDVDAMLAEQERLEASQKKTSTANKADKPLDTYRIRPTEKQSLAVNKDRTSQLIESPVISPEEPQVKTAKKRTSLSRKMLFAVIPIMGLAFLGFYLPKIIHAAGYAPEILNSLLKPYGIVATFEVVTLDWNKPVEIKNVKLSRLSPFNQGNPANTIADINKTESVDSARLLELDSFQTAKSLWEISQAPTNPGAIILNQPKGYLILTTNEQQQSLNNWSEVISNFTQKHAQRSTEKVTPIDVRILNGTLEIKDLSKAQQMSVTKLNMDFLHNLNSQRELAAKTGSCQTDFELHVNQQNRPFTAQAAWEENAGNISLKTEQFPLGLLQPYLNNYQAGLQLTGNATSLTSLRWVNEPAFKLSQADFSLNAEQVAFTCNELNPQIVTIPQLLVRCTPRLNYQAPDPNQPVPVVASAQQIPSSWDLTTTLDRPMLITPVLNDQQQVTKNYRSVWDDQQINLTSNLEFESTLSKEQATSNSQLPLSQVNIRELKLISQSANIQATGKIQNPTQLPVIDLQLNGVFNSQKICSLINESLAQQLQFEGLQLTAGRIQGSLQGKQTTPNNTGNLPAMPVNTINKPSSIELAILDLPAASDQFVCQGDLQWQKANLAGFPVEQGLLNAYYTDNSLKLTPRGFKIMQGELRLQPTLKFIPNDIVIQLPEGKILDHAILTKEFSRDYLKYTSPLFAEATAVSGEFSLSVPQSSFSLNQLLNPQLNKDVYQGEMEFYQASIGPGALLGEIAQMVESIRALSGQQGVIGALQPGAAWVDMPAQKVKLLLNQGRLYHDQMIFQVAKVPLVSAGSVGLQDQTLNINMKLTLPDTDKKLLKLVANQDIELKLSGTAKQPRLDKGSLANWGKNLGTGAALNLIDQLIERKKQKSGK